MTPYSIPDRSFVDSSGTAWCARDCDPERLADLVTRLGLHPLLARLLVTRNLYEKDAIEGFLKPSLAVLDPPERLPDIDRAVARMTVAIERRERICIYGDYDVDGLTGTALLVRMFEQLGVAVETYVPDRRREGFGLNADAVHTLAERGVDLLITVDGGSNDRSEVDLARELGIDVIVTDHHPIHVELPDVPIVHPARDGFAGGSPLSGVGVAYKVAWSLGKALAGGERVSDEYRDFMMAALVYVALGTIADVVPLRGDNRVLVHYGLRALGLTEHAGLGALAREGRVDRARVEADHVGYRLAPLLNAAGRVGDASEALSLLLCDDPEEAPRLASRLGEANRQRREIEDAMLAESHEQIAELEGEGAEARHGVPIVVAREGWHAGVAGIVASRLVEHYRRPVFVLAIDDGLARGSARTVAEVPLTRFYDAARPEVQSIGGHAMAGGVVLLPEAIGRFRAVVSSEASRHGRVDPSPRRYDAELTLEDVDFGLLELLESLAPFGAENPVPRFHLADLRLERSPKLVGANEDHLLFTVTQGRRRARAIGFRRAKDARLLQENRQRFGLIAEVYRNEFRGQVSPELRVIAFDFER